LEHELHRPDEEFRTQRLTFRKLSAGDVFDIHRQFSDPDMCRYFSEPPMDLEMARQTIEFFQNPDQDPYCRFVMTLRSTGDFVGTCGFHHLDPELRQAELGYDVWKEYWKRGYGTEALEWLIRFSFERLDVDQLYVLIDRQNEASLRTAARFGFEACEPCRPLDEPNQVCMKLVRAIWIQINPRHLNSTS
jgi:[ribosomal protein S5]-alanine N-acetyltransferase